MTVYTMDIMLLNLLMRGKISVQKVKENWLT